MSTASFSAHLGRLAARLFVVLTGLAAIVGSGGGGGGGAGATPDIGGFTYVKSYTIDGGNFESRDVVVAADGSQYHVGVAEMPAPLDALGQPAGPALKFLTLVHTSAAGDVMWARRYGDVSSSEEMEQASSVSEAPDGSLWLAGKSQAGGLVLKLAADGSTQLRLPFAGLTQPVDLAAIAATPDNGFVLAGMQDAPLSQARKVTGGDLWLFGGNADGSQRFLTTEAGTSPPVAEQVNGILVEQGGEILVFGRRNEPTEVVGITNQAARMWVSRYRQDGVALFNDAFAGEGSAHDVAAVPRLPGSNAALPGLVLVGEGETASPLGDVHHDVRIAYLELPVSSPGPDIRQDENLTVSPFNSNRFVAVVHDRDNVNRVIAAGNRSLCRDGANASDTGCYNGVGGHEMQGFLMALERGIGADLPQFRFRPALERSAPDLSLSKDTTFLDLITTVDGNLLLAARNDRGDVAVAKLHGGSLQPLWVKALQPEFRFGNLHLTATQDGGALVLASGALLRLDANGAAQWSRRFARAEPLYLEPTSITALETGGVVVAAGSAKPAGAALEGSILLRYDEAGALRFARHYAGFVVHGVAPLDLNGDGRRDDGLLAYGSSLVSGTEVAAATLRLDLSGAALASQGLPPTLSAGRGHSLATPNRIAVELSNGGLWWLDAAGTSLSSWSFAGAAATATPDGGAWFVTDGRAVHFRADGTQDVGKRFALEVEQGSSWVALTAGRDYGLRAFQAGPDGGLVASGAVLGSDGSTCGFAENCFDGLLMKLDAQGQPVWAQAYGAARLDSFSAWGKGLRPQSDNGVLVDGFSNSFNYPSGAAFSVRTDANGQVSAACLATSTARLRIRVQDGTQAALSIGNPTVTVLALPTVTDLVFQSDAVTVVTARACGGESTAPVLTITASGGGTVNSTPAGITCGADCAQAYSLGAQVSLQAVADNDRIFTGWGGACAGFGTQATMALTMTGDVNCSASFAATPPPPQLAVITQPPVDTTVTEGSAATFTVVAVADGSLTYQWQRSDGGGAFVDIAGATSSTFTLTAQAADNGARLRVGATNPAGTVTSAVAQLTVTPATPPPPPATLFTLSFQSTQPIQASPGAPLSLPLVVTREPGFTAPITLRLDEPEASAFSHSLTPDPVTGGAATLEIQLPANAPAGVLTFTVRGTATGAADRVAAQIVNIVVQGTSATWVPLPDTGIAASVTRTGLQLRGAQADPQGMPVIAYSYADLGVAGVVPMRFGFRRFNGAGWEDLLPGAANDGPPLDGAQTPTGIEVMRFALLPDGTPVVCRVEYVNAVQGLYVYRWNAASGSWTRLGASLSMPTRGTVTRAALAAGSNGRVVIAFLQDAASGGNLAQQVFVQSWDGAAWTLLRGSSTADDVDGGRVAGSGGFPVIDLALDGQGLPTIAFGKDSGDLHVRRFDGLGWGATTGPINSAGTHAYGPALALDASGQPVVAWKNSGAGVNELLVTRVDAAGMTRLTDPTLGRDSLNAVANQPVSFHSLVRDGQGRFVVVWTENQIGTTAVHLHARRYVAGSGFTSLGSNAESALSNHIGRNAVLINGDGEPVSVWLETVGPTNATIKASRWLP